MKCRGLSRGVLFVDFGFLPLVSSSNHLDWVCRLAARTDLCQINPQRSQIYTPLLEEGE